MVLLSFMDRNMFPQINLLGEAGAASSDLAGKWPLTCVSPEMIKEIVPFPERHATVEEATF
jgi:hypothetical protein